MTPTRIKPHQLEISDLILEIKIPDSLGLNNNVMIEFKAFLQQMANRRCVGALRYGDVPDNRQRYLTRLRKELTAYSRTGNAEHLFNIANYAFLESAAPQHPFAHFDPNVASVIRRKEEGIE